MAQNYRNQSGHPDESRGARWQTSGERDRYRTGGEQRFNPDWDDRSRSFEGDRSYSAGGYSEEFGYRRGRNRDESDRDAGSRNYQSRGLSGANYQSGRSYGGDYDREGQSRFDEGRFDEGNRWESAGERDYGSAEFYTPNQGTSTSRWQEDESDRGGYFGTGSYIDEGGASQGIQRDFYRSRAQQERDMGSYRDRGNTGDYANYGRSYYGSQANYGRGQAQAQSQRPWRSQQGGYEDRSSWNYGNQRGGQFAGQFAGSGSSAGAYGIDAQGSGRDHGSFAGSQSFRGKGPQGYQRSDERLKEMICERLTDDPYIDASNVTIDVAGQVVKLSGTVDDRSTKYEIEELVERMGRVKDIDNQLRVQSSRLESQRTSGVQGSGSQNTTGQQTRGGTSSGTSSGASTAGSPGTGKRS